MGRNRYYQPDEINDIIDQARSVCRAWTTAPPWRIAKEIAALRRALGMEDDGNGHRKDVSLEDLLDDETVCAIGGG